MIDHELDKIDGKNAKSVARRKEAKIRQILGLEQFRGISRTSAEKVARELEKQGSRFKNRDQEILGGVEV